MKKPDPKTLAELIYKSSFSSDEKKEILEAIPFLSDEKLVRLYEKLKELVENESRIIAKMKRLNLKYQILLEEEIKKAKRDS